jgi:ABC-type sugar transport system ATPase subunit
VRRVGWRLLAVEPRVLLLDEPTANLDETNAARVERLVADWRRGSGGAVLWISHSLDQVRRVADRHLVLEGGRWKAA